MSAAVASIHSASWVLMFIFLKFVSCLFWYWFSQIFFFFVPFFFFLPPPSHLLKFLVVSYLLLICCCDCGGGVGMPLRGHSTWIAAVEVLHLAPLLQSWPSLLLASGENHCYQPFSTSGARGGWREGVGKLTSIANNYHDDRNERTFFFFYSEDIFPIEF